MEAISEQAMRIVRLFNKNTTATKVTPSVGAEQEYFLIDRAKYLQRKDLIFSGRTLFGAPAPKGQELEDHYFGVIRERIVREDQSSGISFGKVILTVFFLMIIFGGENRRRNSGCGCSGCGCAPFSSILASLGLWKLWGRKR